MWNGNQALLFTAMADEKAIYKAPTFGHYLQDKRATLRATGDKITQLSIKKYLRDQGQNISQAWLSNVENDLVEPSEISPALTRLLLSAYKVPDERIYEIAAFYGLALPIADVERAYQEKQDVITCEIINEENKHVHVPHVIRKFSDGGFKLFALKIKNDLLVSEAVRQQFKKNEILYFAELKKEDILNDDLVLLETTEGLALFKNDGRNFHTMQKLDGSNPAKAIDVINETVLGAYVGHVHTVTRG